MATILEMIQEKYPGVTDDARNIAEALGMAAGGSGRGAGSIADAINVRVNVTFKANGGTGEDFIVTYIKGSKGVVFPKNPFEAPQNKTFDYWTTGPDGTRFSSMKYYPGLNLSISFNEPTTLYAIWKDAE